MFASLPTEELERLSVRSVYRRLARHEELTQHGGQVDVLIVVGRGRLKVTLPAPDGQGEFLVGTFVPGDVIGEIGLFEELPRHGCHSAITESEVVIVSKADLFALMRRYPEVSIRLLEEACTKMRFAVYLGMALSFLDLPSRLYQRLVYLASSDSTPVSEGLRIDHGLSQKELADSIGVTRESLSRLLAEWKEQGFVDYRRGYIVIRDPAGLAGTIPPAIRSLGFLGASETTSILFKKRRSSS